MVYSLILNVCFTSFYTVETRQHNNDCSTLFDAFLNSFLYIEYMKGLSEDCMINKNIVTLEKTGLTGFGWFALTHMLKHARGSQQIIKTKTTNTHDIVRFRRFRFLCMASFSLKTMLTFSE